MESPSCWMSSLSIYIDVLRIIVGRRQWIWLYPGAKVCSKGGIMTKRRVEGAQWGGWHGYEITISRDMVSPYASVQIRKKCLFSNGKKHRVGNVGWVLFTPLMGILGKDTPYLDNLVEPYPQSQLNGTGTKKVSFLQEKYPERGHGEQRSTLWFYRQKNWGTEKGNMHKGGWQQNWNKTLLTLGVFCHNLSWKSRFSKCFRIANFLKKNAPHVFSQSRFCGRWQTYF